MRKIDLPITAPRASRGGTRMVLVGDCVLRAGCTPNAIPLPVSRWIRDTKPRFWTRTTTWLPFSNHCIPANWFTGLWLQPDFRKLWGSLTITHFGGQITFLALPLTAALLLNASPFEVGVLTALEALPYPLFGLFAGVIVDRARKLPVIIVCRRGPRPGAARRSDLRLVRRALDAGALRRRASSSASAR